MRSRSFSLDVLITVLVCGIIGPAEKWINVASGVAAGVSGFSDGKASWVRGRGQL